MIAPADGGGDENQNVIIAPVTPPTPLIQDNRGNKGPMAAAFLANNDNDNEDKDKDKNNMAAFPVTPVKNKDDEDKNKNKKLLVVPPPVIESDKASD